METKKYIETIYNERKKFILIGLTGRTGSGCSESSKILATENFEQLKLRLPKNRDFLSKEEHKYKIIHSYAKENWQRFYVLRMSDVIFSFLLRYNFDQLCEIIKKIMHFSNNITEMVIYHLTLDNDFVSLYKKCYSQLKKMWKDKLSNYSDKHQKISPYQLKKFQQFKKIENYNILLDISQLHNIFKEICLSYSYGRKKDEINNVSFYHYFLQKIANNIRTFGDVISVEDVISELNHDSENIFYLAKQTNKFIKIIHHYNIINKQDTLICIDAFRNPYEIQFFKDRYSAFYLFSISTEDCERKRRLNYLSSFEINNLDKVEYSKEGIKAFTEQNISHCLELSDVHIYNPFSSTDERFYLTEQLIKYVMLIKHPGLVTPSHIERCMQLAYVAKLNSGCLSRQVGAVITDENFSVKAIGWNEVPEGQVPCNLRTIEELIKNKDEQMFSQYELEDTDFNSKILECYKKIQDKDLLGRCYQYCFKSIYNKLKGDKNQVHTRALHAEENAFLQLAKYGGEGIKGGNLFTTASPCELCSKKAFQLGIKNIYYIDPYPGISSRHILSYKNKNGDEPRLHLFIGAVGEAYISLYTQKLPIKDEINLLCNLE